MTGQDVLDVRMALAVALSTRLADLMGPPFCMTVDEGNAFRDRCEDMLARLTEDAVTEIDAP